MTSPFSHSRKGTVAVCLPALIALMILASGCTQPVLQQPAPAAQQTQSLPAPVTVTRTDSSHMTVAYPGSSDTTTLLELKATVTDSTGKIQTKSAGDHLSTSPLKFGATIPLTGTFTGNSHVVVTGYFLDGSQKLMLDTTL